jgi:AcrR family transcriptional regulator
MAYPAKTDRAAILAAALEQIAEGGMAQLSLRSVAAKLGVAPNALYRYFSDRAHLEAALSSEGAALLLAVLREAAGRHTPEDAIRAMALAYLQFAREQAPMHEVVMMRCDRSEQDRDAHHEIWLFLAAYVTQITGEASAQEAAVALWAFLRGMAALEAAEVFSEEKPVSGLDFGMEAWFRAARAASNSAHQTA